MEIIQELKAQNATLMKDRKLFLGEGSRYMYNNDKKTRRRSRKSTYLEKLYDGLKKPLRNNKWLQAKRHQHSILRKNLPATHSSATYSPARSKPMSINEDNIIGSDDEYVGTHVV
jgi:hypothetical protein